MTGFKPGDRVHERGTAYTPATIGTVRDATTGWPILVLWDDGPVITPHLPQHLEPLGETMSKTEADLTAALEVILRHPEGPASDASIYEAHEGKPDGTIIIEGHVELAQLAKEILKLQAGATGEAAAKALAILEAAGVEPLSEHYGANNDPSVALSHASHFLAKHAELTQAAAKEAADREALEGEALALFNSTRPDHRQIGEWGNAYPMNKKRYTEVALKARELYGVKA